jgi:hypothetical protein
MDLACYPKKTIAQYDWCEFHKRGNKNGCVDMLDNSFWVLFINLSDGLIPQRSWMNETI